MQRSLVPNKGGLSMLGPSVHQCCESLGICENGCWWLFHAKTTRAGQRRAIYAGTFRTRYSESLGIVRGSATLSNCKDRTRSDNKHIHILGETPLKASLHSSGCRSGQNIHLKLLLDILIKYGRCVSRLHIISSLLPQAISMAVILVTENNKLNADHTMTAKLYSCPNMHCQYPPNSQPEGIPPYCTQRRRGGRGSEGYRGRTRSAGQLNPSTT
eukprot:scaffold21352_cov83-Cyclotella_meneghiniana.AAC.2